MDEILHPKRVHPLADLCGGAYFVIISALLFSQAESVAALTAAHPYAMGFAKFALLATFGECLKNRLLANRWLPDRVFARALVWGLLGMWLTAAFPFVDGGGRAIVAAQLWPAEPAALWRSVWMNILSGTGFLVMLVHYWVDTMLVEGPLWPWSVLGRPETARWGKIVIVALVVFWTPMHTVTFLLPSTWRILFAAYLGIALGLILSLAVRR